MSPANRGSGGCPRCGLPLTSETCLVCEWPAPDVESTPRPRLALAKLKQQIARLESQGILSGPLYQSLSAALDEEDLRLSRLEVEALAASRAVVAASESIVVPEVIDEPAPVQPVPPQPAPRAASVADVDLLAQMRTAKFEEQRRRLAEQAVATVPTAPPAPRRSWGDLLATFMEERNMRWGELVGGLLIICCSIALVISFWSQIASQPWLKYSIFNGVTALLFGIGFYSEHQWRLKTTSQGVLMIASLLVPLNFLAITAMSGPENQLGPAMLVGEIVAAGVLGAALYFAGRILVSGHAAWFVVGVMVPSLGQLFMRRYLGAPTGITLTNALTAVPVTGYLLANAVALRGSWRELELSERTTNGLYKLLGITSFATVVALALWGTRGTAPLENLRQMALVAGVLGLPAMLLGLTVWQRRTAPDASLPRTTGLSLAIFGAMVVTSSMALAWPQPAMLLSAAILTSVIFALVARTFRLPAAIAPAGISFGLAYLLAVYLAAGELPWWGTSARELTERLVSATSGAALAALVMALGLAAGVARWRASPTLGPLEVLLAGWGATSVALITWFGWGVHGDPAHAGPVYLLYALGGLVASARSQHKWIAWTGTVLLLAAVVQLTAFRFGPSLQLTAPGQISLLLFCSLTAALLQLRNGRMLLPESALVPVQRMACLSGSLGAAAWLLASTTGLAVGLQSALWIWLSAVWLALLIGSGWILLGTLVQAGLAWATVLAAASFFVQRTWFQEAAHPLLMPWTVQIVGCALAGYCLIWSAIRSAARKLGGNVLAESDSADPSIVQSLDRWLSSRWLSVDRIVAGGLLLVAVAVAVYAAAPGTLQELSITSSSITSQAGAITGVTTGSLPSIANFRWRDIPHEQAAGWGSWLLIAAMSAVVIAMARAQRSSRWMLNLYLLGALAPLLAAAWWEADIAVASAVRWLSVGYLLIGSATIWGRNWLGSPITHSSDAASARGATASSLVLLWGVLPTVAIGGVIVANALMYSPQGTALADRYGWLFTLGGIGLFVAGMIWLVERQSSQNSASTRNQWTTICVTAIVAACLLPLVALLTEQVSVSLARSPLLGPAPGSFFAQMGAPFSYTMPLLLIAAVVVGYSVSERSTGLMWGAACVLAAAATIGYLLTVGTATLVFDRALWVRLAQVNAGVMAAYALAWRSVQRRGWFVAAFGAESRLPWQLQAVVGPALMVALLAVAWCQLVWHPQGQGGAPVMDAQIADVWGVGAFLLVCASLSGVVTRLPRALTSSVWSALMVAVVVLAAVWMSHRDLGNWLSYNTLLVGHQAIALVLLALAWRGRQVIVSAGETAVRVTRATHVRGPVLLQGILIVLLSLRELDWSRWWAVSGLALTGAIIAPALAMLFQQRRYLYVAAGLINLAGSIAWIEWRAQFDLRELAYINVALLALPALGWLLIELRAIRGRSWTPRWAAPPMHRTAVRLGLIVAALAVGTGLAADATQTFSAVAYPWLSWLTLIVLGAAALACLWDEGARDRVACLYLWGLVACGMLLGAFHLEPTWLLWMGTIVGACYALATSYLWSRRTGLRELTVQWHVPWRTSDELAGLGWLVPCNVLLVLCVVVMTFAVQLSNPQFELRLAAAQATLVQVVSLGLLARGDRRGVLQQAALVVAACGAVAFGLSWLQVGVTLTWLNGLVVVSAATAIAAVVYGFGLTKLLRETNDWLLPAQRLTPWMLAASAAATIAVLSVEMSQFATQGTVTIGPLAIAFVALTLLGIAVAAVLAAVVPGRDPLGLSQRGRTAYIYGAEIVLALLFVHVRITLPELFTGFFQQFWPLVVMGLAFLGVGLAEVFRRRQLQVLSEPLKNTGALLPVLPVLGYWAMSSSVNYSLLLVCVGLLYAGLSIARRSFGFGLLAALAANGGLWYFLSEQQGWGFLAHPQVWLIPPALCVLGAAYLNRRQLTSAQLTAIRYLSTMTIYISSTADIFVNGVGQAPWLPLVLAGLAIAGILAGIVLQIRAFLFLGLSFLALALFTIIWYAAVDLRQTWIWYASGIVTGVLIIAFFALFEKKRLEMLELMARLKQWEP